MAENDADNVIEFEDEDGNINKMKIIQSAEIAGETYFLVTDDLNFSFDEEPEDDVDNVRFIYKDGDVEQVPKERELECYLMKQTGEDEENITLEAVDDEDEVEAITGVFAQLMDSDDVEIQTDD